MSTPVTVFIADDSAPLTEVLRELLADPGNVEIVGTADSAQSAIADIHRLGPDILVIDLQLKHGNGFDVIAAIRNLPEAQNTEIILFTNHISSGFRKHAMDLGADHFLDKSKDHARIIEIIQERVLQRRPHSE